MPNERLLSNCYSYHLEYWFSKFCSQDPFAILETETPRELFLYGLYLLVFTILEIKTEKIFINSFKKKNKHYVFIYFYEK